MVPDSRSARFAGLEQLTPHVQAVKAALLGEHANVRVMVEECNAALARLNEAFFQATLSWRATFVVDTTVRPTLALFVPDTLCDSPRGFLDSTFAAAFSHVGVLKGSRFMLCRDEHGPIDPRGRVWSTHASYRTKHDVRFTTLL